MTVLYVVSAVFVLLAVYLFLIFPSCRRHRDIEIISGSFIAHRGLHSITPGTPENSIPAFLQAAEMGFAIENDIHLTADGAVVVFHDDTLKRMCGDGRRVEDCTLAEIRELRLADTDERIPTLEECLRAVNGRVPLLIEFKTNSRKAAKKLCTAADAILSKYTGKYFVQSFYPPVLSWYRKHRKDICRGQLSAEFRGEAPYKRIAGMLLFDFLSRPDFISYDKGGEGNVSLRAAVKLGALPVGWTFRNRQESEAGKSFFKSYIFENFLPNRK